MNDASPARRAGLAPLLLVAVIAAAAVYAGIELNSVDRRMAALEAANAARDERLADILDELTRFRLEASVDGQGPQALLEVLRTYAPLVVSSGMPEPEYKAAMKQMRAVLRALKSLGPDAMKPVMDRIAELDPTTGFDELKWLLEATIAIDEKAGVDLARKVLLGLALPTPRLRWYAADKLLEHDRPLAQRCLRQVLMTESSRGVNLERLAAYGAVIPDIAALSTTGFHNFVIKYVRSEDPEVDDTLLMVMGRAEHDIQTIQECVKALGEHKCERAVEPIQKAYEHPPGFQHNPLFQVHCLKALASIQGEDARPFFERSLETATTDTVANCLKDLLAPGALASAQSNSIAPPGKK